METTANKPLLLFAPIYDFVAEQFVDKMNEVPENEPIDIWVNSPGGRVFAGWSIIGAMQKRTGKKNVTVMGHAASMAVYFALFADDVEALEISKFMIHRADGFVEKPEDQEFLDSINVDLRKQMELRLDMNVFESVTGKTLDQIFDPKQRIDLWIDAKQAKKIGLVNRIKKLNPQEIKAYNEKFVAFADFEQRSPDEERQRSQQMQNENKVEPKKETKMTLQELTAQHPEIVEAIQKNAVALERERVGSYMAYIDIDKDNVIKAVNDGTSFNSKVMAEMAVKMHAKATASAIESDSTKDVATQKADDKTSEAKEIEAFQKEVEIGVKKINI